LNIVRTTSPYGRSIRVRFTGHNKLSLEAEDQVRGEARGRASGGVVGFRVGGEHFAGLELAAELVAALLFVGVMREEVRAGGGVVGGAEKGWRCSSVVVCGHSSGRDVWTTGLWVSSAGGAVAAEELGLDQAEGRWGVVVEEGGAVGGRTDVEAGVVRRRVSRRACDLLVLERGVEG
jgi:hypothetical protein